MWKFEMGDIIIWPCDSWWTWSIIAKIIDRNNKYYLLLWSDGSSGWTYQKRIEKDYKKLDWDVKFFDLFVFGHWK